MPIRINLLAEAHAAEEMRRKDPVKRAILIAGLLITSLLLYSSTLQVKIVAARSNLNGLESNWKSIEKKYQTAVEQQGLSLDTQQKLKALETYTTNRFLWATLLNAFQQTVTKMEDLRVMRLKTEQAYYLTEGTKPKTNGLQVVPGRPGTATEKITLTVDALDSSLPQPGGNVKKFKEAIAAVPYFQQNLQKTNGMLLTQLSAPINGPLHKNQYVTFTLQLYFPEKTR